MRGLREIRNVSWKDILSDWKAGEDSNPFWQELYHSRGFARWQDWRKATHREVWAKGLVWKLYEVNDPAETVPDWNGGPFKGWQKKYYGSAKYLSFQEIVKNSQIRENMKISELMRNFAETTTVLGLIFMNEVYVIDGMHRCCALALAPEHEIEIKTNLKIILAKWSDENLPELGIG